MAAGRYIVVRDPKELLERAGSVLRYNVTVRYYDPLYTIVTLRVYGIAEDGSVLVYERVKEVTVSEAIMKAEGDSLLSKMRYLVDKTIEEFEKEAVSMGAKEGRIG